MQTLIAREQRNNLGIYILGSLALNGVVLATQIGLLFAFSGLNNKPAPSLVQLEAGKSIATASMGSKERTPAVIQKFTQDTMVLLLSASGKINAEPDAKDPTTTVRPPVNDPGVEIALKTGSARITTIASVASFGLSEDFRTDFLKQLAQITPQGVFRGQAQAVLIAQDVSVPEKVGDGMWKLVLIANLISFEVEKGSTAIPFNKEIFVRSVLAPSVLDVTATNLERQIGQVRASGLEIYAIQDYVAPNLK